MTFSGVSTGYSNITKNYVLYLSSCYSLYYLFPSFITVLCGTWCCGKQHIHSNGQYAKPCVWTLFQKDVTSSELVCESNFIRWASSKFKMSGKLRYICALMFCSHWAILSPWPWSDLHYFQFLECGFGNIYHLIHFGAYFKSPAHLSNRSIQLPMLSSILYLALILTWNQC